MANKKKEAPEDPGAPKSTKRRKSQKDDTSKPSPKKKRLSAPTASTSNASASKADQRSDVSDYYDSEADVSMATFHNDIRGEIPKDLWPENDLTELLRRIEKQIPENDHATYKCRIEHLIWEEIAFNEYTPLQCRQTFETITERVRKFRLLREVLEDGYEWIKKPWTHFYRSNKSNRHPDKPARPLSSFMIFYLHMKDKVKKDNPEMDLTSITKHVGELYRNLSDKQKNTFKDLATQQRKEYLQKQLEFKKEHPEIKVPIKAKLTSELLPPLPEKSVSAVKLYIDDKMQYEVNKQNFDKTAFIKECNANWKELSDEKKIIWINWAIEKEEDFKKKLATYMSQNPNYEPPLRLTKSVITKEERLIIEKHLGKPEKPPASSYSLYSKLMLGSDEFKDIKPVERMSLIAQKWKQVPSTEKQQYQERLNHLSEQYKLNYATYLQSLPPEKQKEELLKNKKTSTGTKKKVKPAEEKIVKEPKPKKAKSKKSAKKVASPTTSTRLMEGEPEAPPKHPFSLFAKSFTGTKEEVQQAWQLLPEKKQHKYNKQLEKLKQEYIVKYEKFLKGLTPDQLEEYAELKANEQKETEEYTDSEPSDSEREEEDEESDKENHKNISKGQSVSDESENDDSDDDDPPPPAGQSIINKTEVETDSSEGSEYDSD